MSKLYIPIGMIGSGKSTWINKFAKDNPNTKIVSKDVLREMSAGYYTYIPALEDSIRKIANSSAAVFLDSGMDVIMDECHLTKQKRQEAIEDLQRFTTEIIAIVFPLNSKAWHIRNRSTNLRGLNVKDWEDVYDCHKNIFEPFDPELESYFTSSITVEGEFYKENKNE